MPILLCLFAFDHDSFVSKLFSKLNLYLSRNYQLNYDVFLDKILLISFYCTGLFFVLKIIRFFIKPDVYKLTKKNEELLSENKKLTQQVVELQNESSFLKINFENTLKGFLSTFARNYLGFGRDIEGQTTNNERISFFTYDSKNKRCTLQVRYSCNNIYDSSGQLYYSSNKGIIGKALQENEHFDNNFPDVLTDEEGYIKYHCDNYYLSEKDSKSLTMKPRLMYAYAIKDSEHSKNIGVIVIESTEKDRYDKDELHQTLEQHHDLFRHFMLYSIKNNIRGDLSGEGF